jgi:hypothetical protein
MSVDYRITSIRISKDRTLPLHVFLTSYRRPGILSQRKTKSKKQKWTGGRAATSPPFCAIVRYRYDMYLYLYLFVPQIYIGSCDF